MKPNATKLRMDQLIPVYSPRTNFKLLRQAHNNLLSSLTLNIDKYTIDQLKKQFMVNNNELSLEYFISLLKKSLKEWQPDLPNRDMKMTKCIHDLYKELDAGRNSGKIYWEKLTNYVINKVTQLKTTKFDEIRQYTRVNFKMKDKWMSHLHKVIYVEELDRLAFFEEGGNKVYFINHDTGIQHSKPLLVEPKQLTVETSLIKKDRQGKINIKKKNIVIPTETIILDIMYLSDPKYQVMLTSSNDGFIRGWKIQGTSYVLAAQPENQQDYLVHEFVRQIYCMAWDSLNEVLYCSDKEGSIMTWNLKTDIERPLCEAGAEGHNLMVMSMVTMPKLQFMASGGMDGRLILWDTINNRKKWIYKEHLRGILALAFNQSLILLFSAGFDHQICIWNPYISNIIHKVQVHSCPIFTLHTIPHTNQLISMDSQGNVKIIDVRRFNVVSSFSVNHPDDVLKLEPTSMAIIPKPLKLAMAGRTIVQYEYDRSYVASNVDDNMAICCNCIPDQLSLFTPVGNKIKIWSLLTGEIQRILVDITHEDISTFRINNRQYGAFVGDTAGNIKLINLKTGGLEKELPRHHGQVSFVLTLKAMKIDELVLTCGSDNEIRLLKENDAGRYDILRTITIKKEVSVTCLAYSQKSKSILVGTNFGVIGFYEIETCKLSGSTHSSNSDTSVTSICHIEHLPFIIETNSSGRVSVVAIPPHQLRFHRVFSFIQPDSENPMEPTKITTALLLKNKLFLADDKGFLKCYNLNLLFEELANIQRKNQEQVPKLNISSINYFWAVRAHSESIRDLSHVPKEAIIITCSEDKKVKLWSSDNGSFIDQLEQNFQKEEPQPIGYQKAQTMQIVGKNFKDKIEVKEGPQPTVKEEEFDPRWLYDRLELPKGPQAALSNKNWNVFVKFDEVFKNDIEEFEKTEANSKAFEQNYEAMMEKEKDNKAQKLLLKGKDGQMLTPQQKYEQALTKSITEASIDRQRHLRDPQLKAHKLFLEDIKHLILKKPAEQHKFRRHQQRQYSQDLYRGQPITKLMNKRDVTSRLSKEEISAAYNLGVALSNADSKDTRALKFVNIQPKGSRASLHDRVDSSVKLPKI